ncbi:MULTISPECIES: hypothetical protein [unclassified Citromicrobium]|uniref:hypothetical protein n=1 Tax=unclassified Citromicrobium TaxID=2630544 RepID=UPI000AA866A3|nr:MULTISPECIES: hypothetical protein [unclassified Citromicrobium]
MAACNGIPEGITFGDEVMALAGLDDDFLHSGRIKSCFDAAGYTWVNRGDPIGELSIEGSEFTNPVFAMFTQKTFRAFVRSPVSGLILHSDIGSLNSSPEKWNSATSAFAKFAILLPDDEPRPEDASFVYSEICDLARSFARYYLKSSRYWSQGPLDPEDFQGMLTKQMRYEPIVLSARPNWDDYLDEARTKHPCLRPYLKHLR